MRLTNAFAVSNAELSHGAASAIKHACSLIAPSWPLDRFIAVNALWEFRQEPIEQVSARLAMLINAKTTMSCEYFLSAYRAGKISETSLISAARLYRSTYDVDELIIVLEQAYPSVWLSIAEIVDLSRDRHKMRWQDEVVQQVSQFCGEFVSQNADNLESLYSQWLSFTSHDYGMSLLMGEKHLRQAFYMLPSNPKELFAQVFQELDMTASEFEIYSHKLLLSINGWASYFSWQRWESRLENKENHCLESLLAIRMAWDLIIWRQSKAREAKTQDTSLRAQWLQQKFESNELIHAHTEYVRYFWIWTHAAELEYQKQLHQTLKSSPILSDRSPELQAVFCIDVRSERIRRLLELQSPTIQTKGFAGFFGLPISYQPAQSDIKRPQLPALMAPSITVTDHHKQHEKLNKIRNLNDWKSWTNGSVSAFTMVETAGWTYAFKLVQDNFFSKKKEKLIDEFSHHNELHLERNGHPLDLEENSALIISVLKAMGLTENFAPIVLLVGHGSQTRNNLHASGLDCGACGGQTGEVNVRVLARLLNDKTLRLKLSEVGINIPDKTRFIAALHNTTTDEIKCFEPLPDQKTKAWLKSASILTRRERAFTMDPALRLLDDKALERALISRAKDWSEVRPEWGLANNSAFIVAPRDRTRGVDLEGRVFLHDYVWDADPDFELLEQIMTAPMIVTHWINMQYNLSVTDNVFFGSGNKLLHNAVGMNVGVFEGNGGDLRIGLPLQSIHDGTKWRHTPLRLSVYIAAPRAAIEKVIASHDVVRELTHNHWLFLFRWTDHNTIERYRAGEWEIVV